MKLLVSTVLGLAWLHLISACVADAQSIGPAPARRDTPAAVDAPTRTPLARPATAADAEQRIRLSGAVTVETSDQDHGDWARVFLLPLAPAIISLIAAWMVVVRSAKTQEKIAEGRALFEMKGATYERKVRQQECLYAPLHALLGQSRALYLQMNDALECARPDSFRRKDGQFQIKIDPNDDGSWTEFRTVFHLHKVYGLGMGVDTYFDEIVQIGSRLSSVITKYAGYVRSDQPELLDTFNTYLAHYRILRMVHKNEKTGNSQQLHVTKAAAFPREIQDLVRVGLDRIIEEVSEWTSRK